jgi:hypothetical protein
LRYRYTPEAQIIKVNHLYLYPAMVHRYLWVVQRVWRSIIPGFSPVCFP